MTFNADSTASSGEGSLDSAIDKADNRMLNQTFDLLRNQQRRHVLETLYATGEKTLSTDDIADHVLTRVPDATDRDRVLIRLHHQTLPRLADDGVVEFDPRTDTVRYRGTELVDGLLAVLAE